MRVKLLSPVVLQGQLYRQGVLLEVDALIASRWVHDGLAVPVVRGPQRQVLQRPETRSCNENP